MKRIIQQCCGSGSALILLIRIRIRIRNYLCHIGSGLLEEKCCDIITIFDMKSLIVGPNDFFMYIPSLKMKKFMKNSLTFSKNIA